MSEDLNRFEPDFSKVEQAETEYEAVASDYAYETAAQRGLDVVLPGPADLFLDFDNETDYMLMLDELFPLLKQFLPNAIITRSTTSPSGELGHHHVVVNLGKPVEDARERVLLQAVLGSDRKRELLAWRRIENDDPVPTLFFEKPITGESNGTLS